MRMDNFGIKTIEERMIEIFISRDYFIFSSAHFAQLPGGVSERLHGHNYSVKIWIGSEVDELGCVFDFADVKKAIRLIVDEFNHYTLLPGKSPRVTISYLDDSVIVSGDGCQYTFPKSVVRVLPISNTTCEELAAYIGERLLSSFSCHSLEVAIEECPEQGAIWRYRRKPLL